MNGLVEGGVVGWGCCSRCWLGGALVGISDHLASRPVNGAAVDSRLVREGQLFFALRGRTDGADFAAEAADADGWRATLDAAWAALEPVFAASPYLAGLARRWPDRLRRTLDADPEARLAEILAATDALTGAPAPADLAASALKPG